MDTPYGESEDLCQCLYVSTAIKPLTEPELDQLLFQARKNNKANSITGMLLYVDGHFMQAIEGAPEAMHRLLSEIEKDDRHAGMVRLIETKASSRSFSSWSMGYAKLTRSDLEGAPFGGALISSVDGVEQITAPEAMVLLKSFKVE